MRSKEEKSKHKGQETIIGKIIYGFLLFLPLLAIGVTCGYAMFNKNAYQSNGNVLNINYTNANTQTSIYGQEYQVRYNPNGSNTTYQNLNILEGKTNINNIYLQSPYKEKTIIKVTIENNGNTMYCFFNDNTYTAVFSWQTISNNFNYTSSDNTTIFNTTDKFYQIYSINYVYGKLTDIFYYSIDKVTENPLFKWAKNSFVYTTTENTCTQLHITTPFIPLLISYWLIISVIYFLFDIALMLVWTIHKKVHELQESI